MIRSGNALGHSQLATVAIGGGKILSIVPAKDGAAMERRAKRRVDLQGALLLPGFVDTHTHLAWAGQARWEVRWQDVCDRATALERLRVVTNRIKKGFWLLGGTWSREQLPEAELPTLPELDAVTGRTPLYLISEDRSLALANSRAMELFRLNSDSVAPAGGVYEKTREGNLSGRFHDTAARARATAGVVPSRDRYRLREELRAALETLARYGITEAHDIATVPVDEPTPLTFEDRSFTDATLLEELDERGELGVRVSIRPPLRHWKIAAAKARALKRADGLVTCRGVKLLLDSGLYSIPFKGGGYTYRYPGFKTTLEWMRGADRAGLQVSIHALGDRGVTEALDLFEKIKNSETGWQRRPRLIHGRRIAPDDIGRVARLGVVVEAQPWEMVEEMQILRRHFDEEFLATAYPFRSLLDAGARVAFSSDWRMEQRVDHLDVNPLAAMYVAVTRRWQDREPNQPHQQITIAEAINGYTGSAAWAEGAEKRRGSIARGKQADLVVLDKDIFAGDPEDLLKTKVLFTVVAGKIVYSND